ncbi:hypothetical protein K501DRAFT_305653 [Backusella circina FSU 941]|nr:hypothetical protein K501DRAFT_305653 [Backusella circina FSU 941]
MSITQLRVMPFQYIDDHTLYCVRVKVNNFRFYDIKRPFLDYVQFSQRLQQHLPKNNHSNNNIPKLKRNNISKLLKSHTQKHLDRQEALIHFIKSLLMNVPPEITRSEFFMDFFSDYSVSLSTTTTKNALKRVFSTRRPIINTTINTSTESILSRPATISCMASSPPLPSSQQKQNTITSDSSSSSSSMHSSHSSSCSDIDMEEDDIITDDGEMIKLKIIYNTQNIIIIRVPRSILWEELDNQVRHKFALLNIDLPEKMVLQVTVCRNSTSSSCSDATVTDSVISKQDELSLAMQMNWSCLEKVTLRITL